MGNEEKGADMVEKQGHGSWYVWRGNRGKSMMTPRSLAWTTKCLESKMEILQS